MYRVRVVLLVHLGIIYHGLVVVCHFSTFWRTGGGGATARDARNVYIRSHPPFTGAARDARYIRWHPPCGKKTCIIMEDFVAGTILVIHLIWDHRTYLEPILSVWHVF